MGEVYGDGEGEEEEVKIEKQKVPKQPPPKKYKKILLETFSNKMFSTNELEGSIIQFLQPVFPV